MSNEINKTVDISGNNNLLEPQKWVVSGNLLCKYMKKEEYLFEIVDRLAIVPRYNEEIISYLNVQEMESISFPMVCFCDTPLHKVTEHKENYGDYGIAFSKPSVVARGDVQPILYLNVKSRLYLTLQTALSRLMNDGQLEDNLEYLADSILDFLLYTKPIEGFMPGKEQSMNFQDECEWRYIPPTPKDVELVLPQYMNTEKGRDLGCKELIKEQDTWFRFEIDDVKYIIVPNKTSALNLINHIENRKKIGDNIANRQIKDLLISKVTISADLEGDM